MFLGLPTMICNGVGGSMSKVVRLEPRMNAWTHRGERWFADLAWPTLRISSRPPRSHKRHPRLVLHQYLPALHARNLLEAAADDGIRQLGRFAEVAVAGAFAG